MAEPTRPAPSPNTEQLVSIVAACPACGRRESRRIAAWRAELYRAVEPSRVCETIECRCGVTYVITAAAYQGAA